MTHSFLSHAFADLPLSKTRLVEDFPWLRSRIPCLWTRSYFTCTVGHLGEEAVKHYIEQQKGV